MEPAPEIILSQEPKSEVACGLIYSKELDLVALNQGDQIIAGERLSLAGSNIAKRISCRPLMWRWAAQCDTSKELARFLSLYTALQLTLDRSCCG